MTAPFFQILWWTYLTTVALALVDGITQCVRTHKSDREFKRGHPDLTWGKLLGRVLLLPTLPFFNLPAAGRAVLDTADTGLATLDRLFNRPVFKSKRVD